MRLAVAKLHPSVDGCPRPAVVENNLEYLRMGVDSSRVFNEFLACLRTQNLQDPNCIHSSVCARTASKMMCVQEYCSDVVLFECSFIARCLHEYGYHP